MKIDVYDFDGTLYNGDSTIDFYKYALKHNIKLSRFLPIQITYFLLYKFKLVKKEKFKEKFFIFLTGIPNINESITNFWAENQKKIRLDIIKETSNYKYIISASPYFLLENICNKIGNFTLIATDVNNCTGTFNGKNCYGKEKVHRLKEHIKQDFQIENFYSDSMSDIYLASMAKNSYFIKKNGTIQKWNFKKSQISTLQ